MMGLLILATFTSLAAAIVPKLTKLKTNEPSTDYEGFRRKHGHRQGTEDSVSYETRRQLYHSRLAEIDAHNVQKRSWAAGVNKFADYTNEELQQLLGYRRWARSSHGPTAPASFLQLQSGGEMWVSPAKRVAAEVDWRAKLHSSKFVRDQGACGSCWAVAAVGALEMQSELKCGNTTQLSFQQLVDCVPNPKHCGGTGGCSGATAELAFEYVHKHGLNGQASYSAPGLFRSGSTCSAGQQGPSVSITGWQSLPTNKVNPLMLAVANHGPSVVSVDGSKWMPYSGGVFDGCEEDAVVNHAVLAVGYGAEDKKLYWLIRNSWGGDWGAEGHIKLLRHAKDNEHCGMDNDPKQGNGCDGGPAEVPVCGMCGILSDSSHPVGAIVHA